MVHPKGQRKRSDVDQFLKFDPRSDTPIYRQIAAGILIAQREGRIEPGRLPPTRTLARKLRVNRNTVVAAYRHLEESGVVRGHTGRGTFLVRPDAPPDVAPSRGWSATFARAVEGADVTNLSSVYSTALTQGVISFGASYPAAELLPVEPFRRAVDAVLRQRGAEALAYGPTAGYAPLREWIARDLRSEGAPAEDDLVLVTNGSQQAIDLIFRALVDPGDAVVLEDPSYTGALSVLASLGARRIGVPLDEEGIRADLLARALEQHRPRVVYLQPTFHNPTARVMSERRRREVLELAEKHHCAIVEDDWARDLRLDGTNLPTLHAMDGGRNVLHIGTFSKKLLPGLRIGWVAAPRVAFDRLVALKQISDCGTSLLLQDALHRFLHVGALEAHLGTVRAAYRSRRERMIAALGRHAPPEARFATPEGGLFVWVSLPEGCDADALAIDARGKGVLFSPGTLFHVDGGGRNTLRLTYSAASPEEIDAGVATLGELMRSRLASGGRIVRRSAADARPIM